jgi:hypothetical protein
VQPGKLFHLTAKFPAGYEVIPTELVEVSMKSNHPDFAVIRVPVVTSQPRGVSPETVTRVAPKK